MTPKPWWQDTFVLSTFASIQQGDNVERIIELLAEAGLNTVECNCPLEYRADDPTREEITRALVACEKHGLRFFVTDHQRMTGVAEPKVDDLKSIVEDYASYPALAGYYVWDEPETQYFAAVRMMFDTLKALDSERLSLNALVPSYGHHRWPDDYPAFVRGFVSAVDPPVLSFDYYSVSQDPNIPDSPVNVSQELYRDLALWSNISRETGKPLWFYPSACKWGGIAKPTLGIIRLQVNTAIAYGATGIQYFQARGFSGGPLDFTDAPINPDGTKGPSFDIFKSVNEEVSALAPLYPIMKLEKVTHTAPVPEDNNTFEPGYEGLLEASDNLIISFMRSPQGQMHYFVVNKDPVQTSEITLRFSNPVSLVREPGRTEPLGSDVAYKLEAGQAILLSLET